MALGFKGALGSCCSLWTVKLDTDFLKWKLELFGDHKADNWSQAPKWNHEMCNAVKADLFFFASLDSEEAFGLHPYENNGFPEWSIAVYDS